MVETVFPLGKNDTTVVDVVAGGVSTPRHRQAVHLADPFVSEARFPLFDVV